MSECTMPLLLFRLKDGYYCLSTRYVKEVQTLERVVRLPDMPATVRGYITVRGQVMPVVDTRLLLGLSEYALDVSTLVETLERREEDHHRWLDALEASLRDGHPFRLARDPHACAFGKWYDQYQTDDFRLALKLRAFDAPHRYIHALADHLLGLCDQGAQEEALRLLEEARLGAFTSLITLFTETRTLLQTRMNEVVIVLALHNRLLGLVVDKIEAVKDIEDTFSPLPQATRDSRSFISGIAKAAHQGRMVMMLDPTRFNL